MFAIKTGYINEFKTEVINDPKIRKNYKIKSIEKMASYDMEICELNVLEITVF